MAGHQEQTSLKLLQLGADPTVGKDVPWWQIGLTPALSFSVPSLPGGEWDKPSRHIENMFAAWILPHEAREFQTVRSAQV